MIIVSQDRKTIVNFNNLTQIYITYCEEDDTGFFIRFGAVDSSYDDLGEYATEERAREVLLDIYSKISDRKINYKMPQE